MSVNLVESTGEGSTRKRSPSPIRRYLVSSPTPTKQPLTSSNDNITKDDEIKQIKTVETTTVDTKTVVTSTKSVIASIKPSNSPKVQSRIIDLIGKTKKSALPSNALRPPTLKRSYSAITNLDNVNKSWMSQPSSKKKLEDNTEAYDRLAPSITDMVSAQAIMALPQTDYHGDSYNEQVAKACGIEPSKRILSFTAKPPATKKVDIRRNSPQLKLNSATSHTPKRRILSSPEKILDAPYMADDYYLNVLDWSKLNVVAVGLGKSVYLWNADNGTIQALKYDYDDAVASVSWSGDGTYLAIGTTSGDTQIWDVESNTKLRSMTGQDCRIGVLSWDRHLVSSGAADGSIVHHDVRAPKHEVRRLEGHTDEVCGLKWRSDGQALASGGNDNTVNIWDARSTTPKFTRRIHTGAVKALAWCPWSRNLLATGGGRDDKKIHFWNTTTGTRTNTIHAGSQVTSLHWSKHYKEITSTHGAPHNHVTVWEYPTLNKVIDIPAHDSRILHSALSPDGQVLATAAADENLKFWRVFESDGLSPLNTQIAQSAEKKNVQLRRSNSIR